MNAGSAMVTAIVCSLLIVSLVLFARGLEHSRGSQQVTVVVVQTEEPAP